MVFCQIAPHLLTKHVNEVLIPSLRPEAQVGVDRITEQTVQCWLWKLGFRSTESKKGVYTYTDGHECPDVLAYRKTFIDAMSCEKGIGR